MRGTRLRLILDGEPLLSATDDAISIGTAGIASGFGTAGTAEATTETTGMHLDNFRVTPPAADAVGAHHGGFLGAPLLRVLGAIAGDVDTAASFDGVGDTATLTSALRAGEIDIALIGQEGGVVARDFYTRRLAALRVVVALPEHHPLATCAKLRFSAAIRKVLRAL